MNEEQMKTAVEIMGRQNVQAVRHWAAMTRARAEELTFIGMTAAAEQLHRMADLLDPRK